MNTTEALKAVDRDRRLVGATARLALGGHFAAWEQPKLFSEEVRAAFRSLRRSA
jgi:hypothetical protein